MRSIRSPYVVTSTRNASIWRCAFLAFLASVGGRLGRLGGCSGRAGRGPGRLRPLARVCCGVSNKSAPRARLGPRCAPGASSSEGLVPLHGHQWLPGRLRWAASWQFEIASLSALLLPVGLPLAPLPVPLALVASPVASFFCRRDTFPLSAETAAPHSCCREYDEFDIDYEIVQTLGEGGFGRVLLVRNRKRNVQFAMKELSESGPDIHREVELLVTLTRTHPVIAAAPLLSPPPSHPPPPPQHVVSYFDRFVRTDENGAKKHCIMMDYVRGVNLLDYVKKQKPVNNSVIYWFLKSALEALAHMHEMRISHRDIKPENYIVAPYRVDVDGRVVQRLVTIDFGLGSFLKRGGFLYAHDAEEVVGTPNYNSPQVLGLAVWLLPLFLTLLRR